MDDWIQGYRGKKCHPTVTDSPESGEIWFHSHLKVRLKVHVVDRKRNLVHGWVGRQYVTRFLSHFSNPREGWLRISDN